MSTDFDLYGDPEPGSFGPNILAWGKTGPDWVYVHLAEDGTVLYVGLTGYPDSRTDQHRRKASWFNEIAEIRWQGPFFPADAAKRELALIKELQPVHNRAGKKLTGVARFRAEQERAAS